MQSADLQLLLQTLQHSEQARSAVAPAPIKEDVQSLLNVLRFTSQPAQPEASTSQVGSPVAPPFESFQHRHDDPLMPQDDEEDDYQGYEALSRPDLRFCSFAESLAILGDLCQSEAYLIQLQAMKKAQEEWEIRQIHRRNRILLGMRKQQNTVKDLKAHDIETLQMYDELRQKQQRKLEELGTPVISVSEDKEALKRQQRVLNTIEMLLEDLDEAQKQKRP